jgi:hypothetical protein
MGFDYYASRFIRNLGMIQQNSTKGPSIGKEKLKLKHVFTVT